MFIGHFGVGLAAKKIVPKLNLGVLFILCQLLDLIWPVLVLLNIEHVSVEMGATVVTPFNFSHYPFSHSLFATLVYSLIAAIIFWYFFKSIRICATAFVAVLSHWILDFFTHRPDLPIFVSGEKFGLGLWNSLWGTFIVEASLFFLGVILYAKSTSRVTRKKSFLFWSMISFLSLVYVGNVFGPKPPSDLPSALIAGPALSMWLIIIWGYFSDKK